MTVSASAAGSDMVLPKSSSNPGLTVTLTGVISVKEISVLDSYYLEGELVSEEKVITVYQLPASGAGVRFTGKLDSDLFPGGYGGFVLTDGKYQRSEIGNEGQWWYIGHADGELNEISGTAGDTSIQELYIGDGISVFFTFADLSAYAVKSENPFTDVSKSDFYYDAVIWALKNNVTKGNTATTFNPGGKCTSGHVVTFLWRA